MNIPVQTVQQEQDQKKEITLKKKFQHKRKTFESSYSNKSSEEETSSSPEEGETVTVDAKEYKIFKMWRKRMMRFHKHKHHFHGMMPPFGSFGMPPCHPHHHGRPHFHGMPEHVPNWWD